MLERWITVTVLGEAIGFGGALTLGRGVITLLGEPEAGPAAELLLLGLSASAGWVAGACLGLAQWLALRRLFPRLPLRHWVLATAVGAALAGMLGMSAGSHVPDQAPPLVLAAILVAGGLVLGGLLGAAQALALRRFVTGVGPWIFASALGWMLGLLFASAGVALTPEPGPSLANVAIMLAAGATMAIAPALTTGRVLQDFARRQDPASRR